MHLKGRLKLVVTGLLTLLVVNSGRVHASETDKLYRSAEFLGRGYAGLADPRDEDAIFYNPANLAHQDPSRSFKAVVLSPLMIISDTANTLASVGSDDNKKLEALRDLVGKPAFVGASNFSGVLIRNMAFGLVNSASANFYVYKDPLNSGVESINLNAQTDNGLTASYAHSLSGLGLSVGVTTKLIKRTVYLADISIADVSAVKEFKPAKYSNSGVGLGFDVGAIYKLKDTLLSPQFGLTVQNLGDSSFSQGKSEGPTVTAMPQTVNFGLGISPPTPVVKSSVFFDYRDLLNREEVNSFKRFHLGGEFIVAETLGLTTGINQGFPTLGIFLATTYFRTDVGTYGEEVGVRIGERPSRRYFLRLMATI
jgi:hypothetical protein